jgi:hypothetical protein
MVRGAGALALSLCACTGASTTRGDGRVAAASVADAAAAVVWPAQLLPDPGGPLLVDVTPDGTRRLVVGGMRVAERPDGSLERGREVLPSGTVHVLVLPPRLGGGLLIYVVAGASTQVWRAASWLAHLEPVGELFGVVGEMVAGFDRVYARLLGADSGGDLRAFDPLTGEQLPLGPLPPATRLGALAFADGWRALVMSDYRGPLATFDAGNTWGTVPLAGRTVRQLGLRNGELVIDTVQGGLSLRATGELAQDDGPELELPPLWGANNARRASHAAGRATAPASGLARSPTPSGSSQRDAHRDVARLTARAVAIPPRLDTLVSGRRPLRAALEDGWPMLAEDGGPGAIFAEAGGLFRVALPGGRIEQARLQAFSSEFSSCHAVALGGGFGFVCGEAHGPTAVYRFEPPFDLREMARFAEPRVVLASGSGGWVVRGGCARASSALDSFCFFDSDGAEREVTVNALAADLRRDLRPVALSHGRAVLLSPPGPHSDGSLLWAERGKFVSTPLQLGEAAAIMARGRTLEGLEERDPQTLGGWVLVGQELHGMRIGLDGRVTLHPSSANVERSVVSGRFALDWGRVGRGAESVDGGATWTQMELPSFDASRPERDVASCSPVGCVRHGWMRVGWGSPPGGSELLRASAPAPSKVSLIRARGVSLQCEATGQVAGPAAPVAPTKAPATRQLSPAPSTLTHAVAPAGAWPWSPFRGVAPPTLAAGEHGVQAGTDPPFSTQARLYAWGKRGGDWLRAGRWLGRFEDRFDLHGAHSTASATSVWADEEHAAEALGVAPGQAVAWSALLDPGGEAAVLIAQRGGGRVDLYAVAEGEPPLQWRAVADAALPIPSSAVRVGASWYLLATASVGSATSTTVYRVDASVVRPIIQLPRIPVPLGEMPPRLMRRSETAAVGLLVLGAPGFGQSIRDWYVLPLDQERGALGEPARLLGSDLEGRAPARCGPLQEGWLVNTDLSLAPAIRVLGHDSVNLSGIELRLRLDPGTACVDAIAARFDGWLPLSPARVQARARALPNGGAGADPNAAGRGHDVSDLLPLVATHPESGRRWMLYCR